MIETERLSLSPPTIADWDAVRAMWSDADVTRYIGGQPASLEDTWMRLLRSIGHWDAFGWGLFAVHDRASGIYYGNVGLAIFQRELGVDFDAAPEAAWALVPTAQGKGLAAEAVTAAHDWFFAAHGAQRTVCIIAPDNVPSLRLADRIGYRRYREAQYKGETTVVLERLPHAQVGDHVPLTRSS